MASLFFSAHLFSQCLSASFGSSASTITIRAVSGTLDKNSSNFLRSVGLLNFPDGFDKITSRFGARNGMALIALFRSFSLIVRASRRAVFMSALVGSGNSDSNSRTRRMMANSSLP